MYSKERIHQELLWNTSAGSKSIYNTHVKAVTSNHPRNTFFECTYAKNYYNYLFILGNYPRVVKQNGSLIIKWCQVLFLFRNSFEVLIYLNELIILNQLEFLF